uniref:Venom-gland transcript n=1 Tax=Cotesia glomerata TaxID=32391 RepID=A0A0P0YKV0_COTGL|nr:venom-gland transcript [Cotesia glomerata]
MPTIILAILLIALWVVIFVTADQEFHYHKYCNPNNTIVECDDGREICTAFADGGLNPAGYRCEQVSSLA